MLQFHIYLIVYFRILQPKIDDKHSRWLHLRIRPSTLPSVDPARSGAYRKVKTKALVDGRWTLAFRDEESCKSALAMILEELKLQSNEVDRRLNPLLDLETVESSNPSLGPPEASSSYSTPSNSLQLVQLASVLQQQFPILVGWECFVSWSPFVYCSANLRYRNVEQ